EAVHLVDISLVAEAGKPSATIISNTGGVPAIIASGNGRISGFTIRSARLPVELGGPYTLSHNVFDQGAAPTNSYHADLLIQSGAGDAVVKDNTFTDPNAGTQNAIQSASTGSPVISQNKINGFMIGI